ncbi:MAG TPA: hypothetical protein VGN28_07770 [Blastococcus sp.]|nr:hypothetical protein [Blastococcus sp.]
MDTFTLVVVLRAVGDVDEAAVGTLGLWRDDIDPALWRASTDCTAGGLEEALSLGRDLADRITSGPVDATVVEVVAMDDEQQLVWRANP